MLPARLASGKLLFSENIERPFSNFAFVDKYFNGIVSLRRIFSQARRNGCCTLIMEEILEGDDIQEENQDLERHPDVRTLKTANTYRLSFFTFPYRKGITSADLKEDDFIGYAIVRKIEAESGWRRTWVYESVIKPERVVNNFVRRAPSWECRVLENRFKISG